MNFHASVGPWSIGHWPGWDPVPQVVGNNMKWAARRAHRTAAGEDLELLAKQLAKL